MEKTVKVALTLEWEFTKKEYEEAKDFVYEINWKWDSDPMSAVHFMNEIGWPNLVKKEVKVD